jgi:hypothetical protein
MICPAGPSFPQANEIVEGVVPGERAAADSCVRSRSCKVVRRSGPTHASRVDGPLRNRDIPLSSGMATRVVCPANSRFRPYAIGSSDKAAARLGSRSRRFGCPRKWAEKGDIFMSYLYVKWNRSGLQFARCRSRHWSIAVFRWPLLERRPATP